MNVPQPAELLQVFYISRSMAGPSDLQAILEASQRNNAARGLTGALLFTGGAFAQVLEGPGDAVDSVMNAIAADVRHRGMRRLLQHTVSQRSFGGWNMRLLEAPGADDLVQQLLFGPSIEPQRAERLLALMFELSASTPQQRDGSKAA